MMQWNAVIILLLSLSSKQFGTFAVPTDGSGTTRISSMEFDNNKLLRSRSTAHHASSMQQQQQQHEQQQRKLSVSEFLGFSSWIPTLYNKINKKNSYHHSCRKKHWWNKAHCSDSNSNYSKVTTTTTTTTVETTYEDDVVETYEEDDGKTYIQSSQSAAVTDSSSNISSDTSHKGEYVFVFFLALFAGAAIGIALMAYGRLLHKRRKREEKRGLQAPSISEGFARYAENCGCGNRTVLGTIQGDVYDDDDHNSIGTAAMIEVSSVPSTESYDFGGGYNAPQETVDVKVLYNA